MMDLIKGIDHKTDTGNQIIKYIKRKYSVEIFKLLSDANNLIYLINDEVVFKLLTDESTDNEIEYILMRYLKSKGISSICKSFIDIGEINIGGKKYKFDTFRFTKGTSLDKIDLNIDDVKTVFEIIKSIVSLDIEGYGKLGKDMKGSYTKWSSFIRDYMNGQLSKSRLVTNEFGDKVKKILDDFNFDKKDSSLLPMDLNKKNFLLIDDNIKINNFPVVWCGDKLAAYGELLSHFFDDIGELDHSNFFKVQQDELIYIYIYCYFMLFTTLVFLERNKKNFDIKQEKAWGGKSTIYSLLNNIYDRIYTDNK